MNKQLHVWIFTINKLSKHQLLQIFIQHFMKKKHSNFLLLLLLKTWSFHPCLPFLTLFFFIFFFSILTFLTPWSWISPLLTFLPAWILITNWTKLWVQPISYQWNQWKLKSKNSAKKSFNSISTLCSLFHSNLLWTKKKLQNPGNQFK